MSRFLGSVRSVATFIVILSLTSAASFASPPTNSKNDDCVALMDAERDLQSASARQFAGLLNMGNIRTHIEKLSGVTPINYRSVPDRYRGDNKELVRIYLAEYLRSLGISVRYQKDGDVFNIVGEIQGSSSPREVFDITAHYDTTNENMPGADDNGSGLGLILELARVLSVNRPQKTIRFVFMDLEENNAEGSKLYARSLKGEIEKDQIDFQGSIVVDTIAWADDSKPYLMVLEVGEVKDFNTYMNTGSLNCKMDGYRKTRTCAREIAYQYLRYAQDGKARQNLKLRIDTFEAKATTGDHGSYWGLNLPAFLFAAAFERGYVNPQYHKKGDVIDIINWEYYALTSGLVAETVAILVGVDMADQAGQGLQRIAHQNIAQAEMQNTAITRVTDYTDSLVGPKPVPKVFSGSGGSSSSEDDLIEELLTAPEGSFHVVLRRDYDNLKIVFDENGESEGVYNYKLIKKVLSVLFERGIKYFPVKKGQMFYGEPDYEKLRKHARGESEPLPKELEEPELVSNEMAESLGLSHYIKMRNPPQETSTPLDISGGGSND